jgi:hypothetical protein
LSALTKEQWNNSFKRSPAPPLLPICCEVQTLLNNLNNEGGRETPVYVQSHLKSIISRKPFILTNWYSRIKIGELYPKLLKMLGYDINQVLHYEVIAYKHFYCDNENCEVKDFYIPMVKAGKYHIYQSFKHCERVVAQIMDKLEALRQKFDFDYVIAIDLTYPKEISLKLLNPVEREEILKKNKKAVKLFREELHRFLFPDKNSKLGLIYTPHIWRTRRPLEPHLHNHIIMPNIAIEEVKVKIGDEEKIEVIAHRFKPFIKEEFLRELWKVVLIKCGLWNNSNKKADIHIRYIKATDKGRLAHRIRYMFRMPIIDLNEYLKNEDLEEGSFEKVKDFANFLINYTPRRHNLGWLTNLKKMNVEPCRKSISRNEYLCPKCGNKARYLGYASIEEVKDLPKFWIDRWRQWHKEMA